MKRSREGDPQPIEISDRQTENGPQFESTRQTEKKNPPTPSTAQRESTAKEILDDGKNTDDEDLIEDVHSSELEKIPDDRDLICPETNDVADELDEDDDIVFSSGDEKFETPKSSPKKLQKGANCSRQLNLDSSDSDEDKPKLRRKKKQRTPPSLREEKPQSDEDFDDDDTTLIGDDLQATITPKVSFYFGLIDHHVSNC